MAAIRLKVNEKSYAVDVDPLNSVEVLWFDVFKLSVERKSYVFQVRNFNTSNSNTLNSHR